jgi:hypothetical protein
VAATLFLEQRTAADEPVNALSHCPDKCGDTIIPYPFGTKKGCFRDGFNLTCEDDHRAYLGENKTLRVLEIDVSQGEVHVLNHISSSCHHNTANKPNSIAANVYVFRVDRPLFAISNRNKFTAIGCATIAFLLFDDYLSEQVSGCASFCDKYGIDNSEQCIGKGCCQASIPAYRPYSYLDVSFLATEDINYNYVWEYSPCSYAFVAEQNWFNFSASFAQSTNFGDMYNDTGVPMVLDWAVGTGTCDELGKKKTPSACLAMHSQCIDATASNGLGYRCNCSQGYEGNPYIFNGCHGQYCA